jgi:hypothetical protein
VLVPSFDAMPLPSMADRSHSNVAGLLNDPPGPLPACLACSCRRSCSPTWARPSAPR